MFRLFKKLEVTKMYTFADTVFPASCMEQQSSGRRLNVKSSLFLLKKNAYNVTQMFKETNKMKKKKNQLCCSIKL